MIKKSSQNTLNIKTDFLSPKFLTTKKIKAIPFGLGPVKKINFFPVKTKQPSIHKHISSSLVPKKNTQFISSIQYLTPYPPKGGKKVPKKNMNWFQAKQRNHKLNPFGDADKDKVINMFDCFPYDSKRHGVISSIGKAASSVAKAASQAYTSVDKSLGGALPGGAKPTSSIAKAIETGLTGAAKAATIVVAPAIAAIAVGTAIKAATTTTKAATITSGGGSSKITGSSGGSTTTPFAGSQLEKDLGLSNKTTSLGTTTSSPTTTKTTTPSTIQKIGNTAYAATDLLLFRGFLPGGVPSPYTLLDASAFNGKLPGGAPQMITTTTKIEPTKTQLPRNVDFAPIITPPAPEPPPKTPTPTPIDRTDRVAAPSYELSTAQQIKTFFQDTAGRYLQGGRWRPQNVTAMAAITPSQLSLLGIESANNVPLVLNINPNEPMIIPDYILALKPTIIYTSELPTRLAMYTPKIGAAGTEYTEYSFKLADMPK